MVTLVVLLCMAAIVIAAVVVNDRLSTHEPKQSKPFELSKPSPPVRIPSAPAVPINPFHQKISAWKWKNIAFMDVETTGLEGRDRVVTLAIILLHVPLEIVDETSIPLRFEILHRIYNPGRDCNPAASQIHGHSDWELRHQPFFKEEAEEVSEFLGGVDLVVCHNAKFDLKFVNRELAKASMPPILADSFCTMEVYRLMYDGPSSLNSVIRRMGLKRERNKHGALEDAWLAMNVFFMLKGTGIVLDFSSSLTEDQRNLQNLRDVPPMPEGDLPPRKRAPRVKVKQAAPPATGK